MKNKNKKAKLLSISLLALCFSMLAFGVYALKNASLTVQGTVGFVAHDCLVRVSATIAGDGVVEQNEQLVPNIDGTPSETRQFFGTQTLGGANSNTATLTAPTNIPAIYFTDLTPTGVPEVITITFSITNDSFYPIRATITSDLTSDVVTDNIPVASKNIVANGNDTLVITYTMGETEGDYVDFDSALSYGITLDFAKTEIVANPTNATLSGDALSFTNASGVTTYEVAYFSGNTLVSSYEVNSNSVTLTNKPENAGTYTVKIRSKKTAGEQSYYSDYVNVGNIVVEQSPYKTGITVLVSTAEDAFNTAFPYYIEYGQYYDSENDETIDLHWNIIAKDVNGKMSALEATDTAVFAQGKMLSSVNYYVLSECNLENRAFNAYYYSNHSDGTYPNDYANSDIRAYITSETFKETYNLNDEAYSTINAKIVARSMEDLYAELISTEENGSYTSTAQNLTGNTFALASDEYFLLSTQEWWDILTAGGTNVTYKCDEALAKNISTLSNSAWWLRSPGGGDNTAIAKWINLNGLDDSYSIWYELSVRPAFKL